jgi:hypothetical protein
MLIAKSAWRVIWSKQEWNELVERQGVAVSLDLAVQSLQVVCEDE